MEELRPQQCNLEVSPSNRATETSALLVEPQASEGTTPLANGEEKNLD